MNSKPKAIASPAARQHWLLSPGADFWLACGGAPVGLLAAILLILLHGDRELDAFDFVLSEFHLGATYDAVVRRQLWRHRQVEVVLIPLVIVALTYALTLGGQVTLLTSIAMYAAVWHRGRQSFGIARFYQRSVGGPVSRLHDVLFRGAIYLPMFAAVVAHGHLSPSSYEAKPYLALNFGGQISWLICLFAALGVVAYLVWTSRQIDWEQPNFSFHRAEVRIHPGECWAVLAHAVAFGSAYVLGASNAAFVLVLAVYHEVQYLCFTYAMARRSEGFPRADVVYNGSAPTSANDDSMKLGYEFRSEMQFAVAFMRWPIIGFVGAVGGGWLNLEWLAPLGVAGLFCHYWLDGRIWTRRSFQN